MPKTQKTDSNLFHLGCCLLLSLITYSGFMVVLPIENHHVILVSTAWSLPADQIFQLSSWTGYRPLPILLAWSEIKLFGLSYKPMILTSIGLLFFITSFAFFCSRRLTGSTLVATLITVLFVTDIRFFPAFKWLTGYQTLLALMFSLLSILLVSSEKPQRIWFRYGLAGTALLLGSLSKEFAIATGLFIVVWGWNKGGQERIAAAISATAAGLIYISLRSGVGSEELLLKGVVTGSGCRTLASGFQLIEICGNQLALPPLASALTQLFAGLVGQVFPTFLDLHGRLQFEWPEDSAFTATVQMSRTVVSVIVFSGFVMAVRRLGSKRWPWLAVIIGTAILCVPIFRARNLLLGSYVVTLLGIYGWLLLARDYESLRRNIVSATAMILVLCSSVQGAYISASAADLAVDRATKDACLALTDYRNYLPEKLWTKAREGANRFLERYRPQIRDCS